MEQADCSWKHATKPQLSQEFCWNMRNCAEALPKEALKGEMGGVGWGGGLNGGGIEGSFWDPAASGEGNVLWSQGRNVQAVMRVNGSYFENGREADGNVGDELEH